MIKATKGRGRPAKKPIGIFKLETEKRPVGRPKKNKVGRPKESKNKIKVRPPESLSIERRLQVLEWGMRLLVDAVSILGKDFNKKKSR